MLVYRIEDRLGEGVYSKGSVGFEANRSALNESKTGKWIPDIHPAPCRDEGLMTWWEGPGKGWNSKKIAWHQDDSGRKSYVCGFLDEAQMLNWFPPEGMALIAKNNERFSWAAGGALVVNIYDIHARKVRKGSHQIMFRKSDALLVEERAITRYVD
jgi:hypothetical protein